MIEPAPEPTPPADEVPTFDCTVCDKAHTTERGMKIHRANAHGRKEPKAPKVVGHGWVVIIDTDDRALDALRFDDEDTARVVADALARVGNTAWCLQLGAAEGDRA